MRRAATSASRRDRNGIYPTRPGMSYSRRKAGCSRQMQMKNGVPVNDDERFERGGRISWAVERRNLLRCELVGAIGRLMAAVLGLCSER